MIRKLIRQMLTAQIFSALTVSLCLMIDSIMIGRFLGEEAMASYSLANPILLAIGAIGSLLAAGIQTACSKSLGRGSQEETDAGYSSALTLAGGISLIFLIAVLVLQSPLATVMGAGRKGTLFEETRGYLAGFSIGAPASMGALVLVPFLQMAGQSTLLIVAVLSMTVSDIALDLLNVLVFHGGMFGMGLASSISYYVAMVIAGFYFFSRRCVFRFSPKLVSGRKTAELIRGGLPASAGMAATVVLVFLMNRILKTAGGSGALAAFSVITTIGNSANCVTTGIGGISLTLSGIFYHEEDRTGLTELLRRLCRDGIILGAAMGVLLLVFAPFFISLFIPPDGETGRMAVLGLRIYAAGLIPCCIVAALKNMYQATERVSLTVIISVLEGTLFPVLAALLGRLLAGTNGIWIYYACGEALALLCIGLYVRGKTGRLPWKDGSFLLLKEHFGATADRLLEADIHSLDEAAAVSRQAEEFCLRHGQSAAVSGHIALCIEEMTANIIQYGFAADSKPHHLSVRLLGKPDHWVLRFRDDCRAFDPVHYVPDGRDEGLGIRLVLAFSEDANYTYTLNLNNLALKLRADAE